MQNNWWILQEGITLWSGPRLRHSGHKMDGTWLIPLEASNAFCSTKIFSIPRHLRFMIMHHYMTLQDVLSRWVTISPDSTPLILPHAAHVPNKSILAAVAESITFLSPPKTCIFHAFTMCIKAGTVTLQLTVFYQWQQPFQKKQHLAHCYSSSLQCQRFFQPFGNPASNVVESWCGL